jgi:hypothetical protein
MANSEKIELPSLTPEETWLDKIKGSEQTPEKIKTLIYLPAIAYKTAVYAHKNNFSANQKEALLLLFRAKADNAQEIIDTQVSLTVGNNPSDRIGYLKDFESWQENLIKLLKEALDCVSETFFIEKVEALNNDPLFHVNRQEWEEKVKHNLRLFLKLFKEDLYWWKFEEFTHKVLKLIKFGSAMMEITMESPEWMFKAMQNVGRLPANLKYKQAPTETDVVQKRVEELLSSKFEKHIEDLMTIVPKLNGGNNTKKKPKGRPPVNVQPILDFIDNYDNHAELCKNKQKIWAFLAKKFNYSPASKEPNRALQSLFIKTYPKNYKSIQGLK